MYKIFIENLEIEAVMGILDFERKNPQKVTVNAQIDYIYRENYLDYREIADFISKKIITKKYNLIEDALNDIVSSLKDSFPPIKSIKVKINKPHILRNCNVGVEIQKNY